MKRQQTILVAFGALTLLVAPNVGRAEQPPKGEDFVKALGSQLGLNEQQENQIRTVVASYDQKEAPVVQQLWALHHQEKEAMREVLTAEQRKKVPEIMKKSRDAMFAEMAKKLGLDAEQKEKIAKVREEYQPKYHELATEKEENGTKFQQLRKAEFAAISKELTDAQKTPLPAVLKEEFRQWRDPEFQKEHLMAAANELGVSNEQNDRLKKIQADFQSKAEQPAAQLKQLYKDERSSIEKLLSSDQQTKFKDVLGLPEE